MGHESNPFEGLSRLIRTLLLYWGRANLAAIWATLCLAKAGAHRWLWLLEWPTSFWQNCWLHQYQRLRVGDASQCDFEKWMAAWLLFIHRWCLWTQVHSPNFIWKQIGCFNNPEARGWWLQSQKDRLWRSSDGRSGLAFFSQPPIFFERTIARWFLLHTCQRESVRRWGQQTKNQVQSQLKQKFSGKFPHQVFRHHFAEDAITTILSHPGRIARLSFLTHSFCFLGPAIEICSEFASEWVAVLFVARLRCLGGKHRTCSMALLLGYILLVPWQIPASI